MLKFFVTGTDTDVGKTYVSVEIIKFFVKQNLKVAGLKPIASGCYQYKGLLLNDDAVFLQKESSVQLPYDQVNPFRFKPAIAPHIADTQKILSSDSIYKYYQEVLGNDLDVLLVEGVGGWCVPINHKETMADFVHKADLGVIVVVGMKLGCINHAILTVQNILSRNVKIYGWIANCLDQGMEALSDNIHTLERMLAISFLGVLPYGQEINEQSKIAHALVSLRERGFSA